MSSTNQNIKQVSQPDHILSYFKMERWSLTLVTISGILYNVGMIAGPYFEGRLAQCLFDIMGGRESFSAMPGVCCSKSGATASTCGFW